MCVEKFYWLFQLGLYVSSLVKKRRYCPTGVDPEGPRTTRAAAFLTEALKGKITDAQPKREHTRKRI